MERICHKPILSPNVADRLHAPRPEWTKNMHIASQVNNQKLSSEHKVDVPGHPKLKLSCQKGLLLNGHMPSLALTADGTKKLSNVSQYCTLLLNRKRCQCVETFNAHGEPTSLHLQLCDANTGILILIVTLPDGLARFCLKKSPNK